MENFIALFSDLTGLSLEHSWLLTGVLIGILLSNIFRRNSSSGRTPKVDPATLFEGSILESFNSNTLRLNIDGKKLTLDGEKFVEFKKLVESKKKIDAIKVLREETGIALVDGKAVCDAIFGALKNQGKESGRY